LRFVSATCAELVALEAVSVDVDCLLHPATPNTASVAALVAIALRTVLLLIYYLRIVCPIGDDPTAQAAA